MRQFCQAIGRGRRHQDEIGLVGQRDMFDFIGLLVIEGEHAGIDRSAGQALQAQGGDETRGGIRQDAIHQRAP